MKKMISIFAILFSSLAFAESAPDYLDEGMEKEKKIEQIASELTLTEDQKTKIKTSREKYKSQISNLETSYDAAKEKFTTTASNPNASTAEVELAYKQKKDAQTVLQDAIFKSRMEFRDILTSEQRAKLVSKRQNKLDRKHDRREDFKEWKKESTNTKAGSAAPTN